MDTYDTNITLATAVAMFDVIIALTLWDGNVLGDDDLGIAFYHSDWQFIK